MLEEISATNFKEAYDLGQQQTQVIDINGIPAAIVAEGMKVEFLKKQFDEMLDKPRRFEQNTVIGSAQDFIAYFNRYANEQSTIFYNENGEFFATLDWHKSAEIPSFKNHTVRFTSEPHQKWSEWVAKNNKPQSQEDFALFIEDHIKEFEEPEGQVMLEIASTLKATIGVDFKSQKLTHNGQSQIRYEEKMEGKAGEAGEFLIPKEFIVNLQPFKSSSAYRIKAWFRYRVSRDGLSMWYTLQNPHLPKEDAINDAFKIIKEGMDTGHIYRA
ncbi:MAG TPA: DUF2303 family protein [Cellvibrionaceae bacterium]